MKSLGADLEANKIKVEPYWNVNLGKKIEKENNNTIKVEPYWNVNFSDVINGERFNLN